MPEEINDTSEIYQLHLGAWRGTITSRDGDPYTYTFKTREEALVEFNRRKVGWAQFGYSPWGCRLVNSSTKEVEYLG